MEVKAVVGSVPVSLVRCETHSEEQFVYFTKAWAVAWLEQITPFTMSFIASPSPVFPT